MARPKKIKKSEFNPTKQHLNAMAYCIANGIKIYPEMIKDGKFLLNIKIEQNNLTKHVQSPKKYEEHELLEPTYEIYLTYFKRMADAETLKKSENNYLGFINNV